MSGNVELNLGPMKKCLKCKKMISTRSNNCKCGYLLCYVAARVLYFSAFINTVDQEYTLVSPCCVVAMIAVL